jgi:hypothetical protein
MNAGDIDPSRLYNLREAAALVPSPRSGKQTDVGTLRRWCWQQGRSALDFLSQLLRGAGGPGHASVTRPTQAYGARQALSSSSACWCCAPSQPNPLSSRPPGFLFSINSA